MKVLYKAPDTNGFEVCEIANNDKAMQRLVGGRLETVSLVNGYILVYNGYGESQNQPRNVVIKTAFGQKLIVGSFFICRIRGGDFYNCAEPRVGGNNRSYLQPRSDGMAVFPRENTDVTERRASAEAVIIGLNSQNLNERDKLYGLITHTYTDNVAYLAMTGGVRV